MKQLSFNQIQIRVLTSIFIFFTLTIFGYRFFIERPNLERSIVFLAEREISTLYFSVENMLETFNLEARDYAVWTATYDFMRTRSSDYVESNITNDTFSNLRIDGFFLVDEHYNTVVGRGLNYKTGQKLEFEFTNFKRFPENKKMFPKPTKEQGAPIKNGLITTNEGLAAYTAVQIKKSDVTGEHHGFLLLIRLIDQHMFDQISRYSMTKITYKPITADALPTDAIELGDQVQLNSIRTYSHVFSRDIFGEPRLLLSIQHSKGEMPPLLDVHGIIFIFGLMVVVIFIYYIISVLIIRPVTTLADEVKKMESGKVKKLNQNYRITELTKISENFNNLADAVFQQNELLSQYAYIDALTGINNRRSFEDHFAKQAQLCIRHNISFVLIMADVDHFKKFNDTLGHLQGDQALIKVAQTLKKHFRRENDMCARFGGEEFIMLFNDISEEHLKIKLVEIIDAFKQLDLPHPDPITAPHLTVSLGACMVSPKKVKSYSLPFRSVVRRADSALYQAKDEGRNRAVIYKFSTPD